MGKCDSLNIKNTNTNHDSVTVSLWMQHCPLHFFTTPWSLGFNFYHPWCHAPLYLRGLFTSCSLKPSHSHNDLRCPPSSKNQITQTPWKCYVQRFGSKSWGSTQHQLNLSTISASTFQLANKLSPRGTTYMWQNFSTSFLQEQICHVHVVGTTKSFSKRRQLLVWLAVGLRLVHGVFNMSPRFFVLA